MVISFVGFCVAGVAMIVPNVVLVIAGLAVVLIGGVVGKAMSMAGMGRQPSKNFAPVPTEERSAVTAG